MPYTTASSHPNTGPNLITVDHQCHPREWSRTHKALVHQGNHTFLSLSDATKRTTPHPSPRSSSSTVGVTSARGWPLQPSVRRAGLQPFLIDESILSVQTQCRPVGRDVPGINSETKGIKKPNQKPSSSLFDVCVHTINWERDTPNWSPRRLIRSVKRVSMAGNSSMKRKNKERRMR